MITPQQQTQKPMTDQQRPYFSLHLPAMTCSLLDQYQSEIDVIESVAGFTDESTPVGAAWARICGVLARVGGGEIEGRREPTDEEILACRSWSCYGPTFDSDLVQFGRDVLARFGGGEVQS